MNQKILAIINMVMIVILVLWNGYSGAAGINGDTVGGLSDAYENLFTPAGYAFSIWGFIFLGQIALGVFTLIRAYSSHKDSRFISQLTPLLIFGNFLTSLWVLIWLLEWTGLSLLIMLGILTSFLLIVIRLEINLKEMERAQLIWVSIPMQVYVGWITVATVANVSAYLAKLDWMGEPFSELIWAIIMISVATLVNLLMVHFRKMYAYGMVGMWSLGAIAVRHTGDIPSLQYTALAGVALIALIIVWRFGSGRLQRSDLSVV